MRALLVVLDSVGIGHAPDAAEYGDAGADTLGHILDREPNLRLPNLGSLGLFELVGRNRANSPTSAGAAYRASFGRMRERSAGKDTTTGHWELAGAILDEPFSVYQRFPDELVRGIEQEAGVHFLGGYASSGTTILAELGVEHVETGRPILYTSADSVLQIAAHEDVVTVHRLYEICGIARRRADAYRIGRVIARPFAGKPGSFVRTADRHDFSMRPPRTILNALEEADVPVIGVGKISDIFAASGVTESFPTTSNEEGMRRIEEVWRTRSEGLVFSNLVDFDMLFGHRRNVGGYAQALAEFDLWLGGFLGAIAEEDLVIITADHGNDPTHRGTDHTREEVPLFMLHRRNANSLGTRQTFADVAATLGDFFQLEPPWSTGSSFLPGEAARNCATDRQSAVRA